MNKLAIRHSLLLLLAASIWGVAFVAQSVGMDYVGPFTFNAVRSLIGGIVLVPFIFIFNKKDKMDDTKNDSSQKAYKDKRMHMIGGVSCGAILFAASSLQQIGIQYTTVGKAGFITALYIVIVPLISIFLRKSNTVKIWIGVILAVVGMYLLCIKQGESGLQLGDALILGCAIMFSFHILAVEYFSPLVNGIKMSCIQLFTCSFLSGIFMLCFETFNLNNILNAWLPILYAGALSSGVAYTLQIIGQKGLNSTVASLIMSLESVISLLAGWVILGQALSKRELIGCTIVFVAIILVQLPEKNNMT